MALGRRVFLGAGLAGGAGVWVAARHRPPSRGDPVPPDRVTDASVLGIPNERFVIGSPQGVEGLQREMTAANMRRRRALGLPIGTPLLQRNLLAISGGGENGAFGAGLLCGWTEHGSRPEFDFVTGVSAGALLAPFALLGPGRDPEIRRLFTGISTTDVMRERGYIAALLGDSLADNAPLLETISRHLDAAMLADIAAAYEAGRMLLVATVNLDAQAGIWWNIGAIAASGRPGALDLARRILLGSSAIPGLFPPTMLDVTVDGHRYEEMHVDGGALAQTFLYPSSYGAQRRERIRQGLPVPRAAAYVIRNARLGASGPQAPVGRSTFSIAERALAALIRANGFGDIERIATYAERDGIDFNLAAIGPDFPLLPRARFDQDYMRALFQYGYERGRAGYPWAKHPPG